MNRAPIVAYLRREQQPDGSFAGWASPTITPFSGRHQQPTIFPTSLILDNLQGQPDSDDICQAAATYIRRQVGTTGAWNYWDTLSAANKTEPYPDDLDDTACSLAGLTRYNSDWVTAERLGQFARLLVSVEQSTGGPYNTWLVDTAQAPQWQQVDLAVNANIGYALSLQQVCPVGLGHYIEAAISNDRYQSAYYVGQLPVIYFISRWYRGDRLPKLRAKIESLVATSGNFNMLQTALLLAAACQVVVDQSILQSIAERLEAGLLDDHWPASALYIDPVYNGQQYYGGSDVLTTSYALQALNLYEKSEADSSVKVATTKAVRPPATVLAQLRRDADQLPSLSLQRRYLRQIRRITIGPAGQQVYAAATMVASATGWSLPPTLLKNLNLASVNGWLAYTMYDDILDDCKALDKLNLANLALRRSYGYFLQAAGQRSDFTAYIRNVLDTIDAANDWEIRHARLVVRGDVIWLRQLPDYADYSQLAQRSLGHSLAACGVFSHHYGSMQHPSLAALQRFFKHFLIARQLNDDAHDWEQDLQVGHMSAVVTLLLADYPRPHKLVFSRDLDELRRHFWNNTLDTVADLARSQLAMAEQALQALDLVQPAIIRGWLTDLEQSILAAERGRDEARQFIDAYQAEYA